MEDKDEDSGSWKLGMGIVATGLIVIMSVGATSAGYYGEQKLNEKNSRIIRGSQENFSPIWYEFYLGLGPFKNISLEI